MIKVNKKILFVLIISLVCMVSLLMVNTYAVDDDDEIICENIPDDKAEMILNAVLGIENSKPVPTRGNLLCWLTNHIKDYGTVTQTEHSYYSDQPRCRRITTFVEFCTRSGCDYFAITDRTYDRFPCH